MDDGHGTTDFGLWENGAPVDDGTTSQETGTHETYKQIADTLTRKFGVEFSTKEIPTINQKGIVSVEGQDYDVKKDLRQAIELAAEMKISSAKNIWPQYKKIGCIYLGGGGMDLIGEYVRKAFPQAVLVSKGRKAIAWGYYYYAHMVWPE